MSGKRLRIRGERVGFERLAPFRYLFLGLLGFCAIAGTVAVALTLEPLLALAFAYFVAPATSALAAMHVRGLNSFAGFRQPGEVTIDADALTLDVRPARVVPRAEIAEGWTMPLEPNVVVVRLKNGDLASFDAPDEVAANRALVALGLATGQRTLRVRLESRASRLPGVQVLGVLAAVIATPVVLAFAVMLLVAGDLVAGALALAAAAAMVAASPLLLGEVAITGTDGITVRGVAGSRFIPFEGISGASYDRGAVRLKRRGGADVVLPAKAEPGELLAARVTEALARAGARVAEAKLAQLDRRDETITAWRARVAAQQASSGYRDLGIDKDEILEVLDDPACSPERRIAAALALSGDEDERTVKRLRVAVDACANEELRAALELAAEGELDEPRLSHALRPKAPNG